MTETKPAEATKPAARKSERVTGTVVVATASLNADKPSLIAQAEEAFKAQVESNHGAGAKLTVDSYEVVKHHVGTEVTYTFTGTVS